MLFKLQIKLKTQQIIKHLQELMLNNIIPDSICKQMRNVVFNVPYRTKKSKQEIQ